MGNFTRDKQVTKTVFDEVGIRTPRGIVADSFKSAAAGIKKSRLRYPVILKPTHGSRALGVTWDIRSEKDLAKAFLHFKEIEKKYSLKQKTFLIEEMFIGHEYRVLVLNDKVISCVQKIPATVVGDGKSSIRKLIAVFNKTRLRGFKIRIDAVVEETLRKNGLALDSILPKKRVLRLRNNLNMSDGGRSIDVTGKMHPFFRELCTRATHVAGLSFGGVDVIAEDITTDKKNYVVLEINPNPYYNMNEKPLVEGRGTDVSFLLLKQIFPSLKKK
jgi:cyanophycin synthetase